MIGGAYIDFVLLNCGLNGNSMVSVRHDDGMWEDEELRKTHIEIKTKGKVW